MYCKECGQELNDKAIACTKCGCATDKTSKVEDITTGALVGTYLAAVFFPLLGFGLSIYIGVKGRIGHAIGIAALSFFFVFFWAGVFSAFSGSPTAI